MKDEGPAVEGPGRYRHLVEHIQDAVVEFELVDGEPVVREVNEAFEDVFGYQTARLLDEPLNDWIVPDWQHEEAMALDERTADGEINYRRVTRETASGLREFLYRGIPYEDPTTETDGFAVYTELSEITRKERRLQVMNRVLRHNLRNDTNLILAHTTRLLAELDEQTEEVTETAAIIEKAAHDLEALTEEVTDVRRILSAPEATDAVIDCVPLLQQIANRHRERSPMVEFRTDLPESLPVRANRNLDLAVDQLVDNAIAHNCAAEPRVRIAAAESDANGWASLRVDDNGPLIPATETDVITGEAEISATRHGSGLGLWLVKWSVDHFGGELSFATSEMGGNSVRIRLPRGE